ncbi:TrkA-C domain protein [Methanohalobium evestigatum Z-7303]|uniref:TrkA-C domain protein n=1 Tax=Methanohalobium evestigatum (strain ATCC BAA-1072 / DSM 3721 / NBRC 107634 / OCM 161 / Z-7303) TaxID=644295 RepID=D7EAR2_METEZ|nr:potassium channel family protein [Methanohalobium evestigatum]ADI74429.1 TrkA-C domain protein [Methanohalobium evestigatum Z-7303]
MKSKEVKYTPRNLKDTLIEMKDISELMVDLAYSAMIYDDVDIAEEVLYLEEKMNLLDYQMKITAMLSARRIEEAEEMSGVLQVADSSETIANAAGDIAKIVLRDMGIPLELKYALREAEETVVRATVNEKSKMVNNTLGDLELDTETGMTIIALRRNHNWIYDPNENTKIKAGDVLFARGHDEGIPLFVGLATGREYSPKKIDYEPSLKGLKQAVDIIVDMKNMAELSVGLSYSAILFDNEDIAHEVKILESEMDSMKYELQHWVLETAKHLNDPSQLRGLLHLANASETISDAGYGIADTVLRDIETHPVITLAVRGSDEVITKLEVEDCSPIVGKTFKDLKLETETGVHIMAMKRNNRWVYSPSDRTTVQSGDVLIARGTHTGEDALIDVCKCPVEEEDNY